MRIKIKYINGIRFRRFIMTSAQRINQTENHLNDINVFPVADGDTGTNLAVTMNHIVAGIQDFHHDSFEKMIQRIARSALMGARGNSGAILAQFFQGLSEATRGMNRLTTVSFSQAAVKAAEEATMAIADPCEGTIITVMKDWAHCINQLASKTPDFVDLFKRSLKKARMSLSDTPNQLMILKRAGVVDAGAEGFVNLLEGIVDFIEFGKLRALKNHEKKAEFHPGEDYFLAARTKTQFRYCAECLVEGKKLDKNLMKQALRNLGDSQVIAGSHEQVRIHIHTNQPETVFAKMESIGTLLETKVDDMWEQTEGLRKQNIKHQIALVSDSTCDLPEEMIEKYHINLVPIAVQIDQDSFLDRITISTKEVLQSLENPQRHVTTSQPPYHSFEDVYRQTGEENENILSIHISGQLSGTYQAACTASRKSPYHDKIRVIDARTSTVALGLLVIKAARLIEEGFTVDEIGKKLEYHIQNSRIFVSIPTLKYLIRSGRLDKVKGLIGTMIHLKPVITLNQQGAFEEAARVIGYQNLLDKTIELASQFAEGVKKPCFGIAHIQDIQIAQRYQEELQKRFPRAEIFIAEGSPALGVHIGRGGAAIAVMGN